MRIINVVGARPNFMKIAPLIREMNKKRGKIDHILVHTGQHYGKDMSDKLFEQLDIPNPDINLEVGSCSHARQTAKIMTKFEKVVLNYKPNLIVVVGDVNSTMACALVAAKMGIPVAHVEAGLRSFDRTMPEEINRIVTDAISSFLFTPEESANNNLIREGIPREKICYVGNIMIDNLIYCLEKIKDYDLPFDGLMGDDYAVITLHRPSNVDTAGELEKILNAFQKLSRVIKLVLALHPRTMKNINRYGLKRILKRMEDNAVITGPIGYFEMLRLNKSAKLVITDSGGLQEETTYLRIPCITMRENTERPSTIEIGTNILIGKNLNLISEILKKIMSGEFKKGEIPPLWDGNVAERIVNSIINNFI